MEDCPVCCESYTSCKRRPVKCAYCHYDACGTCYRQYILSSMQDAHCMNCRRAWSREMLGQNFPSAWLLGRYKFHREAILVDREKQLLPESQPLVRNYLHVQELRSGLVAKTQQLEEIKQGYRRLMYQINNDRHTADMLEARGYRDGPTQERHKRARIEFTTPCPVEECRGFMGSDMVCGVCQGKGCVQCGVLLSGDGDDHQCSPDDLASFKAIKSTTKPCPKCHVPTFRISGCNQMWCTRENCQTAWDWTTGNIVDGVIHNPHYFQFLRERSVNGEIPRQPGDVPGRVDCNRQRFPNGWDVSTTVRARIAEVFFQNMPEDPTERKVARAQISQTQEYRAMELTGDRLLDLQRKIMHISEVEIPSLRHRFQDNDNLDLRLKYLVNSISEDDFQKQLQRREKRREKDIACRDIYQMVVDTARDALYVFLDGQSSIEQTLQELEAIRTYANTHLAKVQTQFKMVARKV